jgi:outer membrane lipoprotein-sorting protein
MNIRLNLHRFCCVVVCCLLILSLPLAVFAEGFEQLRRDSANIKTIQARFVQKKFMKILARPLISAGRFYYVAPDSFRWEYLKPLRSVVITSSGDTRRYTLSGGKMIEDKSGGAQAMRIVLSEVTGWMSGKFDQNPSFKAALKEGINTQITLTPVGKNMSGMIEKIEITVTKKAAAVKSVKIIESANAYTLIEFTDVEINKVISSSVFQDVQ